MKARSLRLQHYPGVVLMLHSHQLLHCVIVSAISQRIKSCKPAMWWRFFTWFRRNAWLSKCNIGGGIPRAVWWRGLREIYWLDNLLMAWRVNHDIDFCTQGWWGYDNRHKSYVFVYSKPQLASPTSIYIIILTTHHPPSPQYTKILVDENEGIDEAGQEKSVL